MREILYLEQIEQAEVLLKPQRVEVLRQLAEPRTCTEVAARLDQTPQRVYYHVKQLVAAGLVELVNERKVRGITEGIYQAAARSYWLSPRLVGRIGLRRARDELSLGYLLDLMEEVQADIAGLDRTSARAALDRGLRRDPGAGRAAPAVPARPANRTSGPVHPLRRQRRRCLQAGRRLLSERERQ